MNRNPTGRGGLQERPQDINRDGKPKSAKRILDDLLSRMDDDAIAQMNDDIIAKARQGDKDAQKFIYDRLIGTPKQSLDVSSGGEPIGGFIVVRNANEVEPDKKK